MKLIVTWIALLLMVLVIEFQIFNLKNSIQENTNLITTSTEVSGTIIDVLGDLVDSLKGELNNE